MKKIIYEFILFSAAHIEDQRKNIHILGSTVEDHDQQIVMYSNQDPVLASSSGLIHPAKNHQTHPGIPGQQQPPHLNPSRTDSPISHPQLSSSTTPPISVANEIILPHGTIIDPRGMITQ